MCLNVFDKSCNCLLYPYISHGYIFYFHFEIDSFTVVTVGTFGSCYYSNPFRSREGLLINFSTR